MSAADNVPVVSADVVKYDFNRADWTSINQYMSEVDWNSIFQRCSSCDALYNGFYSVLYDCIDKFLPQYVIRGTRKKSTKNYPASVKKILRKKLVIWQMMKTKLDTCSGC